MIRALIIDDEQHCIDRLQSLLTENFSDSIHVMEALTTVEAGIHAIQKFLPDLVFLDIQINNKTGFDLLNALGTRNFDIIFTTAFDQYAVQAFRLSAIDYLLKPVDIDDLNEAVQKLKGKNSSPSNGTPAINVLLDNLKETQYGQKKILVPVVTGVVVLQVSDIIRCQSDVNYTTFYLKDKQKLLVSKTLKEFEEILSAYHFFRVHNSHLINLDYVKSYNRGKGGSVVLTDKSEIEVSTRRKDDFLKKLAEM